MADVTVSEELGHTTVISVPEGTPWWAWLIVAAMIYVIPETIGNRRRSHKQAREQRAQSIAMGRVHHQVANEHDTNLRDDIDVATAAAEKAASAAERAALAAESASLAAARTEQSVGFLREDHKHTRRDIGGIREEVRSLNGKTDTLREDLTDHLLDQKEKK